MALKKKKPIPFEFVLDLLEEASPETKPMFGCMAVYVRGKMVLILREGKKGPADNGVWIITTKEHHPSLKELFPNMRSVQAMSQGVTGWQVLAYDAPDFEHAVDKACQLIIKGDPRIGPKLKSTRLKKIR